MIVDTSALLSFLYQGETEHAATVAAIDGSNEPLVISPYVLAELDYLVLSRHGSRHELAVLDELTSGAWELAQMDPGRVRRAREIVARFADVPIGLADASNIVLAEDYRTATIATLDRRHFAILRLADGSAPRLVP